MNDPRQERSNDVSPPSAGDGVDELASRLLDGDIADDDVPTALRDDVSRRMELFARHRRILGEATPSISDSTLEQAVDRALVAYRRQQVTRRPRFVGIAAAAASILVVAGLGLTRVGSDESIEVTDNGSAIMIASDTSSAPVSDAAKMEQSAAAPSLALTPDETNIEFESADELRAITETWSLDELTEETSREISSAPCLTESSARLVTRNARFRGQPVEIYLSDTGDITVYAQADCTVLLRLGA